MQPGSHISRRRGATCCCNVNYSVPKYHSGHHAKEWRQEATCHLWPATLSTLSVSGSTPTGHAGCDEDGTLQEWPPATKTRGHCGPVAFIWCASARMRTLTACVGGKKKTLGLALLVFQVGMHQYHCFTEQMEYKYLHFNTH